MPEISPVYEKQVRLLLDALPFLFEEECFALKGGTAINLFVRDMPRLSVDIDLVYLPPGNRERSLGEISRRFESVAERIRRTLRGTVVQEIHQQGETISKLLLRRGGVSVKVEVSPVMRGVVRDPSWRTVSDAVEERFGFGEAFVVHEHDLYAGKICAALDRQHPRDFFDVKKLLEYEGIDEALMDVFVVYIASSNQPMAKLLDPRFHSLQEIYDREFFGMTLEKVSCEELEETRKWLVETIRARLTPRHKAFLISFKEGRPDWGLLPFEGVEDLPSVRWKLLNLDRMTPEKRKEAIEKLRRTLHV